MQSFTFDVIYTENHFRKTMIGCMNELVCEFFAEEFKAWECDQKQWEIFQKKIQDNVDLDLANEINQFKIVISVRRQNFWEKVYFVLNTEEIKEEFKILTDYLRQINDLLDKVDVGPMDWEKKYFDIDIKLREARAELKTTFNSERLSVEKELQQTFLEWIYYYINTLPFWLTKNSYAEIDAIKKIIKTEQSLIKTIQQRKILAKKIKFSLESMLKQLKDKQGKNSEIADLCLQLKELLQKIQENLNTAFFKKIDWKQANQELHSELKLQCKKLFEQLAVINKNSLEAVTLYDMKQDAFAQKYQLSPSDFCRAKFILHLIDALKQWLLQPDSIINSTKPKPLLVIDWLDKKDYADLLFLLSLVSPEYLEDCLELKVALYQEIRKDLKNQHELFITFWGEQTETVIRLYRILRSYQRCQETLKQTLDKLDINQESENPVVAPLFTLACLFLFGVFAYRSKDAEWAPFLIILTYLLVSLTILLLRLEKTTLFTLSGLFTYDKKAFFTEAFKKEDAIRLFNDLTSLVNDRPEFKDPQKLLNYLNHEKQLIKIKLDEDKALMMNKYHPLQKFTAFCCLALIEQPSFKMGIMGYHAALELGASNDKLDEIDKLESEVKKFCRIIAGLAAFFCCQYFSAWMEYTYQAAECVRHILFSRFDNLVDLGAKVGFDEMSILEKEMRFNWFLGLGFLLIRNTEYWIPKFLSYAAATIAAFASANIIDKLIKDEIEDEKKLYPNAIAFAKFLINVTIYHKVYSSSLKMASLFFQPIAGMTRAEALKTMEFSAEPSKQELQRQYHKLSLQYHYDKCITRCHNSEANAETMASTSYSDTNKLNCFDDCKTKDQTMRKINEANSILKFRNH